MVWRNKETDQRENDLARLGWQHDFPRCPLKRHKVRSPWIMVGILIISLAWQLSSLTMNEKDQKYPAEYLTTSIKPLLESWLQTKLQRSITTLQKWKFYTMWRSWLQTMSDDIVSSEIKPSLAINNHPLDTAVPLLKIRKIWENLLF